MCTRGVARSARGEIRTPDLTIMSRALLPAELLWRAAEKPEEHRNLAAKRRWVNPTHAPASTARDIIEHARLNSWAAAAALAYPGRLARQRQQSQRSDARGRVVERVRRRGRRAYTP